MKLLNKVHNRINKLLNIFYINYLRLVKGFQIGNNCKISRKTFLEGLYGSIQIGDNCTIEPSVRFKSYQSLGDCQQAIVIKDNVYIGYNTVIDAGLKVQVDEYTMIGPFVYITDANHIFKNKAEPIANQGGDFKKTHIKSNVWVGSHCQILKGVVIGENSIVGANSTVLESTPPNSLIVGIPAKKKKQIFE